MRLLQILFFVAIGLNAFAQSNYNSKEYHVSPTGNNTNDGSVSKPFKTISAAANVAMPGDVITVHAGVYREQITPPRGGNSDQERIVYQAAPGEKVEIKGSEVIKGWQKLNNDTWEVKIPNTFFGDFNPYSELVHGDWFWPNPKDRIYHRGAVYLNGDTTIWANFQNENPNNELIEINVRKTVFYPHQNSINYIVVRGFTMSQAATPWTPPTAEQFGLIGTHWSKGWVIENNTISQSKCVGITLGKYGDEWDNKSESVEGYIKTIERAAAHSWNSANIGHHIVRNNTITDCGQAGIAGSLGAVFSTINHNSIHDIGKQNLFWGYEKAGIKIHAALDVSIIGNHIYQTEGGIWLDWMAQGTRVSGNQSVTQFSEYQNHSTCHTNV